jgi:hypothetical protein
MLQQYTRGKTQGICLAYAVKALKAMHERKEIEGRAAGSLPSPLTLHDTWLTLF